MPFSYVMSMRMSFILIIILNVEELSYSYDTKYCSFST